MQREYCIFAVYTPKSIKIVHVNKEVVFWENQMLPFLIRFYYECMLPKISDSRYNRHMPIRNPKYIIEAKDKTAPKLNSRKNIRQNAESEDVMNKKKGTSSDISPIEAAITITAIAQDVEQDDDCVIVNYISEKRDITEDDKARHEKILDEIIALIILFVKCLAYI